MTKTFTVTEGPERCIATLEVKDIDGIVSVRCQKHFSHGRRGDAGKGPHNGKHRWGRYGSPITVRWLGNGEGAPGVMEHFLARKKLNRANYKIVNMDGLS